MQTLHFSTSIKAPREKVWATLWDDAGYRKWTSAFTEGSYAKTDWKEGSKVLFLDGKGNGMVSKIETSRPNEYMSVKHLGEVKNGTEDVDSEAVKAWAGARENYTLTEVDGTTTLKVDTDITEDFKEYMEKTWPKALEQLKDLCENDNTA